MSDESRKGGPAVPNAPTSTMALSPEEVAALRKRVSTPFAARPGATLPPAEETLMLDADARRALGASIASATTEAGRPPQNISPVLTPAPGALETLALGTDLRALIRGGAPATPFAAPKPASPALPFAPAAAAPPTSQARSAAQMTPHPAAGSTLAFSDADLRAETPFVAKEAAAPLPAAEPRVGAAMPWPSVSPTPPAVSAPWAPRKRRTAVRRRRRTCSPRHRRLRPPRPRRAKPHARRRLPTSRSAAMRASPRRSCRGISAHRAIASRWSQS